MSRLGSITEATASSTGNHGAAVAWAAKLLGIPATIFLPENPNPVKRKRIADLGARIIEVGEQDLTERPGAYYLDDATNVDVYTGRL